MLQDEMFVTALDTQTVQARTGDHGEATCKVRHDPLRASTIEVLESWLRKSGAVSRAELEVLGEHLFETLFDGDVRQMLLTRLNKANTGSPLRLQLIFKEEARALANYSWEYLYLREGGGRGRFLSSYVKLVLSRFMPTNHGSESLAPKEHELRVLLAVTEPTPEELGPVAAQQVVDAVTDVAKKLSEGFRLSESDQLLTCDTKVKVEEGATADKLIQHIEAFRPHVLHLIGHGRFDRRASTGAIALFKNDGVNVDWVTDKQLNDRFINLDQPPRLVFLHMCQGGEVAFERNFAGVAPQLIAAGVQAVVAMQHPISNAAAIKFADEFYRRIGAGMPVDHAVQFGRNAVFTSDRTIVAEHAFGTPVLFMQASDGIIVPKPLEQPAAESERSQGRGRTTQHSTADDAPSPMAGRAASTARPDAGDRWQPQRALPTRSAANGVGAGPLELAARQAEPGADLLARMRKAGRLAAARQGALDSTLASQIDQLAAMDGVTAAHEALDRMIETTEDDTLQLVWSAMMRVLNDPG